MRVVFILFMFLLVLVISTSLIKNKLDYSEIKNIMEKRNQQIQELLNQ